MADQVERYLELALRLGRHDADLVDAYYGPEELSRRVEAEELREPAALAVDAQALAEEAAADKWLAAQVQSLGATARKLGGERADTWSLQPADRVAKQIDSQLRSPSPPYQHTYWQGLALVEAHVSGDPKRFRALLTARLLPRELQAG